MSILCFFADKMLDLQPIKTAFRIVQKYLFGTGKPVWQDPRNTRYCINIIFHFHFSVWLYFRFSATVRYAFQQPTGVYNVNKSWRCKICVVLFYYFIVVCFVLLFLACRLNVLNCYTYHGASIPRRWCCCTTVSNGKSDDSHDFVTPWEWDYICLLPFTLSSPCLWREPKTCGSGFVL